MKRGIVYTGLALLMISCHSPRTPDATVKSATSEDSLLTEARNNFKPLPQVAENKNNPVTAAKVYLGKMLFYDSRLSLTGNNSCNSCHNLQTYGVDNRATSVGDAGKTGERNSPTVYNAALHNMQFWDGRAKDVEEQAGMPILNSAEMAIPHKGFLIDRLRTVPAYREKFKEAFPQQTDPVNYENLQKAIAAFERTLLTPSRFDRYIQGDKNALSSEEKQGLKLFFSSGCNSCHNGVAIGGTSMQRFGLVTDYRTLTGSKAMDEGRKNITKNPADKDVFKVPGLRNAAYTYPYFHDGSIARLDTTVHIMGKAQLNKDLSGEQVRKIVAFLNALSGTIDPDATKVPPEIKQK